MKLPIVRSYKCALMRTRTSKIFLWEWRSLSAQQTLVILVVPVLVPCSVCVCAREGAAQGCSDSGVTGEAFLLRLHHSFVLPVIVSAFITPTAPSRCLPCGLAVSLPLILRVHWLTVQTQSLRLHTPHLLKRRHPFLLGVSAASRPSSADRSTTSRLHNTERQPAQRIRHRKRRHTVGPVCLSTGAARSGFSALLDLVWPHPPSMCPLLLPPLSPSRLLLSSLGSLFLRLCAVPSFHFYFLFHFSSLLLYFFLLPPPLLPLILSSLLAEQTAKQPSCRRREKTEEPLCPTPLPLQRGKLMPTRQ